MFCETVLYWPPVLEDVKRKILGIAERIVQNKNRPIPPDGSGSKAQFDEYIRIWGLLPRRGSADEG